MVNPQDNIYNNPGNQFLFMSEDSSYHRTSQNSESGFFTIATFEDYNCLKSHYERLLKICQIYYLVQIIYSIVCFCVSLSVLKPPLTNLVSCVLLFLQSLNSIYAIVYKIKEQKPSMVNPFNQLCSVVMIILEIVHILRAIIR